MPLPPPIEIVVRGVCISNARLLVCRNVARGNVYLPGGHVEWGETSPAALSREWREELGCDCTPGRFLGILEQRYGDTCELGLYFLCTSPTLEATAPTPPPSSEPHIAFDWLPLADLPTSPLLPAPLRTLLHPLPSIPFHATAP
ncbi:MAG: NUDIX domain-containing protein [Kiritimatiellae bacterium]|nr:NUDIX domain-containing protein [Kiritimatiellia bacterium]